MGPEDKELEKKRSREQLNTVLFDNDIDLDIEKTREQLGFRDYPERPADHSITERIEAAKEKARTQPVKASTAPDKCLNETEL